MKVSRVARFFYTPPKTPFFLCIFFYATRDTLMFFPEVEKV
jgi:hypothetical protein